MHCEVFSVYFPLAILSQESSSQRWSSSDSSLEHSVLTCGDIYICDYTELQNLTLQHTTYYVTVTQIDDTIKESLYIIGYYNSTWDCVIVLACRR